MAMCFAPWELTSARAPAGQSALSGLNTTVAPASNRSSTLSFSHKGRLTYRPGGKQTMPPPLVVHVVAVKGTGAFGGQLRILNLLDTLVADSGEPALERLGLRGWGWIG